MSRAARAAAVLVVAATTLLAPTIAEAHDQWEGAYRKWPWKAGRSAVLTVLPGECPHCPAKQSSSAWKAIDAAMDYETVFAISPGVIDVYEASGGAAGKYLRVRDDDGTYITYEHLSRAIVTKGTIVAGQPIAVSGCTGNCSGPHLHFQRHDGPSFGSTALSMTPIAGHGGSGDALAHTSYLSDNGGVSYSPGGAGLSSMRKTYAEAGGYDGFGVTGSIGDAWSPCRNDDIEGTWFRYGCQPRKGVEGSVQTYFGPAYNRRALMHQAGEPETFKLKHGILAAYTERYYGEDWVYWLGYPSGNRKKIEPGVYKQPFQFGHIIFEVDPCAEHMVINGETWQTYRFCD